MISAAEVNAARAGIEILKKGGNAVDAAVGVGFALAVTFPHAGNLGGGGFMVIRFSDGRVRTIDYREKAPLKARRNMYLDSAGNVLPELSLIGHKAAGVPGSPAGLVYAQKKFGRLSLAQVMGPAISLAEKGFALEAWFADDLERDKKRFSKFESTAKIFTREKGFKAGDTLRQSDLAETMRRIVLGGHNGFYNGRTAELIVEEMERGDGLITHEDLRRYRVAERPPIRGRYRGYEIISMGPPSSGGVVLLQMLNILERVQLSKYAPDSPEHIFFLAEAMKVAYADRAEFLGDPDFVKIPLKQLISKQYAEERFNEIEPFKARVASEVRHGEFDSEESENTTHYSVIDQWGNMVSVTTTINALFGNFVVVEGAGFLLNNEMDDFSIKPGVPNMFGLVGSHANRIEPEKRMLSSMTPTIVTRRGKPSLVLGSPGGSTIITTVLQALVNMIDHGMELDSASAAIRIHHQWRPDTLMIEKGGARTETVRALEQFGYTVRERTSTQGRLDAIHVTRKFLIGSSDKRGNGAAMGE